MLEFSTLGHEDAADIPQFVHPRIPNEVRVSRMIGNIYPAPRMAAKPARIRRDFVRNCTIPEDILGLLKCPVIELSVALSTVAPLWMLSGGLKCPQGCHRHRYRHVAVGFV